MSGRVRQVSERPFVHYPWSPARAWAVAQGLPRLAKWLDMRTSSLRTALGSKPQLPDDLAADLARASNGLFQASDFVHKPAQFGPRARKTNKTVATRAQRA